MSKLVDVNQPAPSCPDCGGKMILRVQHATGHEFWSCIRYPDCRGTVNPGRELEEEVQDAAEYWGQRAIPTPTKNELAEKRNHAYGDAEKYTIFEIVIKHVGDLEAILDEINTNRKKDDTYPVRILDKARFLSFMDNHIQDFLKAARTTIALPTLIRLAKQADQSSIEFGAAREIFNRADGMPTQRNELAIVTYDWAEVEAEKKRTMKTLEKSDMWSSPANSTTPDAEDTDT